MRLVAALSLVLSFSYSLTAHGIAATYTQIPVGAIFGPGGFIAPPNDAADGTCSVHVSQICPQPNWGPLLGAADATTFNPAAIQCAPPYPSRTGTGVANSAPPSAAQAAGSICTGLGGELKAPGQDSDTLEVLSSSSSRNVAWLK